jgi:hypothetical protein
MIVPGQPVGEGHDPVVAVLLASVKGRRVHCCPQRADPGPHGFFPCKSAGFGGPQGTMIAILDPLASPRWVGRCPVVAVLVPAVKKHCLRTDNSHACPEGSLRFERGWSPVNRASCRGSTSRESSSNTSSLVKATSAGLLVHSCVVARYLYFSSLH